MNNKTKNILTCVFFAIFLFGFSAMCVFKAPDSFSESERRALAKFPELSAETILSGKFMSEFETYTLDQFPLRDTFRKIKAYTATKLLGKKENNGIFISDGHISKLDYTLNENMLEHAASRFNYIYERFLKENGSKIYLSIIPDKNYYLAEKNGYLALDYQKLTNYTKEHLPYMQYIDVTELLSADDYYTTDSHWKQENITDIAEHIANEMGVDVSAEYTVNTLEIPFYGVYHGQSALDNPPDTIRYLTNEITESCIVTSYNTGLPIKAPMYNMDKANGKDPYEMFLSGGDPLVVIDNPKAETEKELVIFRDSYGSSLAPLLTKGYKKIILADIRYIMNVDTLGNLIDFNGQDVLFMYSTTLLNNSLGLN